MNEQTRSGGARTDQRIEASVQGCARCGKDHDALTFDLLALPVGELTHWATCPETDEPILLRVTDAAPRRYGDDLKDPLVFLRPNLGGIVDGDGAKVNAILSLIFEHAPAIFRALDLTMEMDAARELEDLRDSFAAHALTGAAHAPRVLKDIAARTAYDLADEMMAERQRRLTRDRASERAGR